LNALSNEIRKAVNKNGGPYGEVNIGDAVAVYHLEYINQRETYEKDDMLCVESKLK
jgi:uncharacterized protein YkuJ